MNNTLLSFLAFLFLSFGIISCGGGDGEKNISKNAPKKATYDSNAKKQDAKDVKSTTTNAAGATPEQLAKAKELIASVDPATVSGVDGKKKYKLFCTTCHGFKGDMNINGAKDLSVSKISLEEAVAQIYHGKGLMTPFKGLLKDEEIIAVAKYIETLRK